MLIVGGDHTQVRYEERHAAIGHNSAVDSHAALLGRYLDIVDFAQRNRGVARSGCQRSTTLRPSRWRGTGRLDEVVQSRLFASEQRILSVEEAVGHGLAVGDVSPDGVWRLLERTILVGVRDSWT